MLTIYGYLADVQKCINCDSAKRLCTAKKTEFEFKSIADSKDENGPIFNENFERHKVQNPLIEISINGFCNVFFMTLER